MRSYSAKENHIATERLARSFGTNRQTAFLLLYYKNAKDYRDKTIADKLAHIPNDDTQNFTFGNVRTLNLMNQPIQFNGSL